MNEITQMRRENARLKMRLDLLQRKLYQVCISHDHLSSCLNRADVPMSKTDHTMIHTTKQILNARTTEEVETLYSEAANKILGANKKSSGVNKVFFFGNSMEAKNLGEDLISKIEKIIADIEEQVNNLSPEDKILYEQGLQNDELDDKDLPEDPMDRNDDLKPPF